LNKRRYSGMINAVQFAHYTSLACYTITCFFSTCNRASIFFIPTMLWLRPCERQNFLNFKLSQNSKHVFFRILYFPYRVKIVFCKTWNIIQNVQNPCYWPKNRGFWPKNPVFGTFCIYGISKNCQFPQLRNILHENWIISFVKKLLRLQF